MLPVRTCVPAPGPGLPTLSTASLSQVRPRCILAPCHMHQDAREGNPVRLAAPDGTALVPVAPGCTGLSSLSSSLGFRFSIHTDSEPGGPYQLCGPWQVTHPLWVSAVSSSSRDH